VKSISDQFDYAIFTSANAVRFLPDIRKLKKTKVVAIGKETQNFLRQKGLSAGVLSDNFTAKDIVKNLKNIKGKKILLPISAIAGGNLSKVLIKKGAKVRTVYPYTTVSIGGRDKKFNSLLQQGKIDFLTFMSPSSVLGFKSRVKSSKLLKRAKIIKTVSIGPRTTEVLKKEGYKNIYTADIFTANGVINKLKQLV
jgi:uroporphyrinogen-III synthase